MKAMLVLVVGLMAVVAAQEVKYDPSSFYSRYPSFPHPDSANYHVDANAAAHVVYPVPVAYPKITPSKPAYSYYPTANYASYYKQHSGVVYPNYNGYY